MLEIISTSNNYLMRVLHITNWYPNIYNKHEALFIKEHFLAIPEKVQNQLWHIQVRSEGAIFRVQKGRYSSREKYLIINTRINRWRVLEVLHLLLLFYLRFKLREQKWDLVNVHIAYPLLRYPRLFRFLFGKKIIITEHWSAYSQNFYLPDNNRGKMRIQRIFRHQIPVITVSQALMDDIISFSGTSDFKQYIVPNVVDFFVFHSHPALVHKNDPVFLMIGNWAPIKRPLLVMEAFETFIKSYPSSKLRIIGYGQQWPAMKEFVEKNELESRIIFLGALAKTAIADQMEHADVLVHASHYETFSVVCAEALCCGLPVIASNVGGIPEFVNSSNGILVENSFGSWLRAMLSFVQNQNKWDRQEISRAAIGKFSPEVVGKSLAEVYSKCCEGKQG